MLKAKSIMVHIVNLAVHVHVYIHSYVCNTSTSTYCLYLSYAYLTNVLDYKTIYRVLYLSQPFPHGRIGVEYVRGSCGGNESTSGLLAWNI